MVIVKMVQTSKYQWQLLSQKDTIICDNIAFGTVYEAEEWVKKYISSYMTWGYKIVTLTKGTV